MKPSSEKPDTREARLEKALRGWIDVAEAEGAFDVMKWRAAIDAAYAALKPEGLRIAVLAEQPGETAGEEK